MKKLRLILAHGTIALSTLFIILLIANRFNSAMEFLSNPVTYTFLTIFSICAVLLGIFTVVLHRRAARAYAERSRAHHVHHTQRMR